MALLTMTGKDGNGELSGQPVDFILGVEDVADLIEVTIFFKNGDFDRGFSDGVSHIGFENVGVNNLPSGFSSINDGLYNYPNLIKYQKNNILLMGFMYVLTFYTTAKKDGYIYFFYNSPLIKLNGSARSVVKYSIQDEIRKQGRKIVLNTSLTGLQNKIETVTRNTRTLELLTDVKITFEGNENWSGFLTKDSSDKETIYKNWYFYPPGNWRGQYSNVKIFNPGDGYYLFEKKDDAGNYKPCTISTYKGLISWGVYTDGKISSGIWENRDRFQVS